MLKKLFKEQALSGEKGKMTDSLEVKDDEDMKETSSRSGKGYTSYQFENKDV